MALNITQRAIILAIALLLAACGSGSYDYQPVINDGRDWQSIPSTQTTPTPTPTQPLQFLTVQTDLGMADDDADYRLTVNADGQTYVYESSGPFTVIGSRYYWRDNDGTPQSLSVSGTAVVHMERLP